MKRNEICIILPTRGRPISQLEALSSVLGNSTGFADVILVTDADDDRKMVIHGPRVRTQVNAERRPMLHILNATILANLEDYPIFGFTADDVLYQTRNWDCLVCSELLIRKKLVAYGNDQIQGKNLPTHPWFRADLVRALGYAVPPGLNHYYFDNFLKAVTAPLNLLGWLPSIVTPHRHHSVGGLHHDAIYRHNERYEAADKATFEHYRETCLANDIEKLKPLLCSSASAF